MSLFNIITLDFHLKGLLDKIRRSNTSTWSSKASLKCFYCLLWNPILWNFRIYSKWSICHKYYIQTVSFVRFEGVVIYCNLCDHKETWQDYIKKHHLKKHQQSKHEGLSFCQQCEYRAILQGNLETHVQSKHEFVRYLCKQCEFQAKRQDQLKAHHYYQDKIVKCSCNQCATCANVFAAIVT